MPPTHPPSSFPCPQASRFQDPVTGEDVTMLIQTDVTARVMAERQLRQVLDAEHKLLEDIFPRQVGPGVCMEVAGRAWRRCEMGG